MKLFSFSDGFDDAKEPVVRLVELLRRAKAWFETAELSLSLSSLLAEYPTCRALFDDSDQIDHVGFLLPRWAKPLVSQAATAAGFPLAHRAFPSALVARELGRIIGQRRLATQIFKGYGRTQSDVLVAFEAFIPDAEDAQVEDWIRRGVCNHFAVSIGASERFARIRTAFAEGGVPISAFMYDRAVYLPGEDATILYFDLDRTEHPFRLEVRAQGDLAGQE